MFVARCRTLVSALRACFWIVICAGSIGCGGAEDSAAVDEDAGADGGETSASDTGAPGDGPVDSSDARLDASVSDGEAGDAVPPILESPCLHFEGDAAWSCGTDSSTLTRTKGGTKETMKCANGCVSMPFGFDDSCRVRTGTVPNKVNGHVLTDRQAGWVHYVAYCAVPHMQGARADRLTAAARVSWWSLKEGVLDATGPNPVGFSLCTTSSGDKRIGPLEVCGVGAPWQVGASAIQVPCCTLSEVESLASKLFPGMTSDKVLEGTAAEATYLPGSANSKSIVGSTGALRTSWLLHNSPIGFTLQAPIVTNECVTGSKSWCFGSGWSETASYAPTKAAAMGSIDDIRGILDVLAP